MPNWCENILTVSTLDYSDEAKEQLKLFKELAQSNLAEEDSNFSELCLNNIVRTPNNIKDKSAWRLLHWGTNRDVLAFIKEENLEEFIVYEFDSAWEPPIEFISEASEFFPLLEFFLEYNEQGESFQGEFSGNFNEGFEDNRWKYDIFSDEE